MKLTPSLQDLANLELVDPEVVRSYLRAMMGCAALGCALSIWTYGLGSGWLRWSSALFALALAVVFVTLNRVRSPAVQARVLFGALVVVIPVLSALAWLRSEGVFSAYLGMGALIICGTGLLLGLRAAAMVAAVAMASVLALLWVSTEGRLSSTGAVLSAPGRALWLVFQQICGLGFAFVAGWVMRRLLDRSRRVEHRQREVFARSPLALSIHRNGRLLRVNDSMARLFGHASAEAMVGLRYADLWGAGEQARLDERHARSRTLPLGERLPLEDFSARRADGAIMQVRAGAARIELHDGPAQETLYFELGRSGEPEPALLRSDALLSRLFLTSPECVAVSEIATGRYLMVNPGFERMSGYPASQVVGRTSLEMGIWHDPVQREQFVREVLAHGAVLAMPVTTCSNGGVLRSMRMSGSTFEYEGQRYLVTQAHDVTQLEAEQREVTAILDNASVGIAFTVGDTFVRVNRCMEAMLGWEPGTLAGQPTQAIWPSQAAWRDSVERMRVLFSRTRAIDFMAELQGRDGRLRTCQTRGVRLYDGTYDDVGLVWIIEDVTQQYRIARELEQARDAAEAGSRAKSAFLANMSHEIRTPLHGVMGLAELASRHDIGTAQRDRYLAQLIDSGRALTHVISEVLDLSKIEAGQMALEARPFDLHDLAQSVYHLYHPDAQTRGLELDLGVAPDVPQWVQGDAVRVRQILVNFSSNAMKFTPRGSVHLRLGLHQDGRIRLSVRDTGVGLDAATRERLFTPFMQADESTTRRFGGTGLGLSICRQLAHLMRGEVGVSSEPGRGSEFWAALPLPRAAAPAPPRERGLGPGPTASALVALETLQGARVLVVEDHPVNMMIATAQLEQWGVEVLQAGDGVEALELLQRQPRGSIDLVLMDLQMPRMGGEQAVRQLRRSHSAQELPVIALSAAALVEEQQGALAAGFNDFVTKPMDSQRLRRVLLQWLADPVAEAER